MRPPRDPSDPRGVRPPREPTDPRGQRPVREQTDPRGQRASSNGPPRLFPATPTIIIATALVLAAFLLGRVTSGGGSDEKAAVATRTVASTTTTTRATKHTVTRGESLLGIASQYGVTLDALIAANGITNQNHVFVGQVLTIPQPTGSVPASTTTTKVVPSGT